MKKNNKDNILNLYESLKKYSEDELYELIRNGIKEKKLVNAVIFDSKENEEQEY